VHPVSAGIELPQLPPTMTKGDKTTMLVIETAVVVEWLVTVTAFDVLVTPTFSSPKLILPGENDSFGALTLASGSADCANAGRANAIRRNNSDKVKVVAIDCLYDLLGTIDKKLHGTLLRDESADHSRSVTLTYTAFLGSEIAETNPLFRLHAQMFFCFFVHPDTSCALKHAAPDPLMMVGELAEDLKAYCIVNRLKNSFKLKFATLS